MELGSRRWPGCSIFYICFFKLLSILYSLEISMSHTCHIFLYRTPIPKCFVLEMFITSYFLEPSITRRGYTKAPMSIVSPNTRDNTQHKRFHTVSGYLTRTCMHWIVEEWTPQVLIVSVASNVILKALSNIEIRKWSNISQTPYKNTLFNNPA